jgi:hypothetical protein
MKIEKETTSYNARRFSHPWIAKVDFTADPKGKFNFCEFVGDDKGGLLLVLDAIEGDIIATGQKDFRKPKNSAPNWWVVKDGTLVRLAGKVEAYKLSQAKPQS